MMRENKMGRERARPSFIFPSNKHSFIEHQFCIVTESQTRISNPFLSNSIAQAPAAGNDTHPPRVVMRLGDMVCVASTVSGVYESSVG